jgi:WD40 repeat protein/tRNA A-37 threonylcarbamoyl transferase component Bud32
MPADPARVKCLFAAALELTDPAARGPFLDRECGDDSDLRRRLAALFAAHDNPESALERPFAAPAPTGPFTPEADRAAAATSAGQVVAGRYKLLEAIGEGGMGEVWVADQLEPIRRRVALKMIKPGMDSRSVLARFEAERQALALMDHPNIARVLDAGTTEDGRPFFVMELVKGTPITEFCDRRRLSPRQRLELFVPVCHAIQHAHQKGVIHRDIKPGNVLVALHDERPVPKVIDFGVAKAVGQQLTEKTIYTGFGALVGTPAYMAPEQATFNQLDVDTRADVYALGVLLYELLAGSPPFDPERLRKAAIDEVLRLVREEEPPRPSARLSTSRARATIAAVRQSDPDKLARLVRGELDWIVMKALEKDRNRRYDTANALAKDVERYLEDEPVEACPPGLGYRLIKYYRRNRAAITSALVLATALVVGTTLSIWQASRAFVAEVRAERERDEALASRGEAEQSRSEADRKRVETNDALQKLRLVQEQLKADQYLWDMQLLPLAFEANNIAEVQRVLDRHIPRAGNTDHRGFEWYYWDRQLHTDVRTDRLPDVTETGRVVEWVASPDGSRVARFTTPVGGNGDPEEPPTLIVWDVAARKVVLRHRMPIEKPVNKSYTSPSPKTPLFSPDGKRVAIEWGFRSPPPPAGVGDAHLRQVVDVDSGKVLLNREGERGPLGNVVSYSAFSPDGRRLAGVLRTYGPTGLPLVSGEVRVWDLGTGKEVCPPLAATALADSPFNPDGTLLVTQKRTAKGTRVSVWDLAGGRENAGWDVPSRDLLALALSPDGTRLAGAARVPPRPGGPKIGNPPAEPQVIVWDISGKELCSFTPPRPNSRTTGMRLYFSPDGARLAVAEQSADPAALRGTRGALTIWDAATGKLLPAPAGLEIHDWSSVSGRGPAFSPDGKQIANVAGNVLHTWDVETGKPLLTLRGHVEPIAARGFTADGRRLWSVEPNGLLKEWDLGPEHVEIRFVAPGIRSGPGNNPTSTFQFAASPDGSRVASVIELRTGAEANVPGVAAVRVWDAGGKSVQILQPPPREADAERPPGCGLALSRDGRRAVLTRYNSGFDSAKQLETAPPPDVTVWDVESKTVLLHQQLERGQNPHLAISPDGKTVAVVSRPGPGRQPAVRLFDIDGRRERPPLTGGEVTDIAGLTFTADGRKLAGVCVSSNAVARTTSAKIGVWDVESGLPLCTVGLFTDKPRGPATTADTPIVWAPDGSRFVVPRDTAGGAELAAYDTTGRKVLTLDQPVTAGAGASGHHYLAYSPDGKRVAAVQTARTAGDRPALKIWDAATGKQLLSLRLRLPGVTLGGKSLTFSGDGHRLRLTELVPERPTAEGSGVGGSFARTLVVTTWDAAPVARREPEKP